SVWVATGGGLSRIRDGRIATLGAANGLPCSNIDSTIEDADGALWLYTSCGIAHVSRADLRAWTDAADRGDTRWQVRPDVLDSRDGAPRAVEFMTMTPHIAIAGDRKVWMASNEGVAVVDPVHLPHNALAPPIRIEQLFADRKEYRAAAGQPLPPL